MVKRYPLLTFFILLCVQGLWSQPLSGNYSIGPLTSHNYNSFTSAVNDLVSNGVSGPVVFNVHEKSGGYVEKINIPGITGASSINTITFQAFGNDEVVVKENPNSASNYIVRLLGADHVHFKDLHFKVTNSGSWSNVVVLHYSSNNVFSNCILESSVYSSGNYNQNCVIYADSICDSNLFAGNEILNGGHGIYFYGVSSQIRDRGNKFLDNYILDAYYRNVYFFYQTDLHFKQNTVTSSSTFNSHYGAMFQYADGDLEITSNTLCSPGYTALYCYQIDGTQADPVLIANNLISSGDGSFYCYGAYIQGGDYLQFVHNTVIKHANINYGYYGLYFNMVFIELFNNIICDIGGGASSPLIYFNGGTTSANVTSNYNAFYSPQGFSLSQWQQSGLDSNSVEVFPGYLSCANPGPCNDSLDGAGTPLTYITTDMNGVARDPQKPDIGAVEWNAPRNINVIPMADTFICDGKTVDLEGPGVGHTFLWNTADTTKLITVNQAGTYTLQFTDYCGGSHIDSVDVTDGTSVADFVYNHTAPLTFQLLNTSVNAISYMWVVDANPSDTFYTQDLTYIMPFCDLFYNVCLYAYGVCDTSVYCNSIGEICAGTEELNTEMNLRLYPVPTGEFLHIEFSETTDREMQFEIMNLLGQTMLKGSLADISVGESVKIDVSFLPEGIHLFKQTGSQGSTVKRFIVKH